MAPLESRFSDSELVPLENLMRRVLDLAMASTFPPGNWCLAHSRRRAPVDNAPIMHKLFQFAADFNAYRDDAHMAAFQPLGVSAFEWETFGLVWQGTASSAETIFNALPHRGYAKMDYAAALIDLIQRGWITAVGDEHYQISDAGRTVRETAERLTDEYFYAPWSCLTHDETEELQKRVGDIKALLENIK